MKKSFAFVILSFLLVGFVSAVMTGSAAQDNNLSSQNSDNSKKNGTQNQESMEQETENTGEDSEIRVRVREENKLRIGDGECPENCTCTGSATKCQLQNGREMTITAGKSGNTIIQTKGENMSTDVQLYKSDGKLYGVFDNETKEVKMMPDQVKEKLREKIRVQLEEEDIELNEDGTYQVQAKKQARLFGLFRVRERVQIELNAETGEMVRTRNSWWGFLATDVESEPIVGASCGTVTSGQNDACCQTKGYDYWDSEKGECLFYSE